MSPDDEGRDADALNALDALENLHAAVWTHFDPGMNRGDKDQPADIKAALTEAREAARKLGRVFDGWQR